MTSSFCIQGECIFLLDLDPFIRLPHVDASGWPLIVPRKGIEKLVGHVGIGNTTNPDRILVLSRTLGAALINGAKEGELDHLLHPLL